ncbi:MAG: DEAD/DEAH box helicase [Desulfobacteraceae bacterium]|nr:MAG: DEAD/DEAH box helicase [Desulfobacteraceae bacterium]
MRIAIENNLRLSGIPPEFRDTLTEKLTFTNPKYIENARMGRYNWKTPKELKFYDKAGGDGLWIPRGFARNLLLLCKSRQVSYTLEDRRRSLPSASFHFHGRLKPFQEKAVHAMLIHEFGTLSAPTGCGKTVMALYMIAARRQPALIVVHTKELAFQWIERIEEYLRIPPKETGLIGAGAKTVGEKITVALVQSLYRCAGEVAPKVGHLVVDECHRTPSRTFTDAVTEFDSRFMLGLSATPWRRDRLSKLIFWHLGDVYHKVDKADLIESGDVLWAQIVVRETDFKPYYDPVREYSKMLSELTSHDERNRLICADVAEEAKRSTGICLVLSDRKAHCKNLAAILRYKFETPSEVLTGDLSILQRRQVLERIDSGQARVLIATGQLIGEGFDCKDLSVLFLSTPIKFSGRVVQYLGRILRPAPGKSAKVYDYVDSRVEVLQAAARSRQKVYAQL